MDIISAAEMNDIRFKYNRNSKFYDLFEYPVENIFYKRWRRYLFSKLEGSKLLEIGVGTGKNLPYYSPHTNPVAIDFSEGMLQKANRQNKRINIQLIQADVQELPFDGNQFDSALATFVFCSVPDPVQGFLEIKRVLKPGGKMYLLEHVLPQNKLLAFIFNLINVISVRIAGVNINRRTSGSIQKAGFVITTEKKLFTSVFKFYVAVKN